MNSELFNYYQDILQAQFNLAVQKSQHPVEKGSNVEAILRSFLSEFLPSTNFVGNGTIIDSSNIKSGQMDIVIGEKSLQPFISDYNVPNLFIVESVVCSGEVKTNLDTKNLGKSINHCKVFKELNPKPIPGAIRFTNTSHSKRFYDKRGYFLFCFKSSIKIERILEILQETYNNIPITEQIDAVFVLDQGTIINLGDGQDFFQIVLNDESNEVATGLHLSSSSEEVIKYFVAWLSIIMPKLYALSSPLNFYI